MAVDMAELQVKLDTTGVEAGMNRVGDAASKLTDRARHVTDEFARLEQEMQGVPRAAAPVAGAYDAMGRKLDEIRDAIREQTQAQREQVRQLEEAARAAKEYEAAAEDAAEGTGKLSRGASALGGLIGGFVAQGALSLLSTGIGLIAEKMREAGRAAEEERAKIKAFFDELDRQIEVERKLRQPFSTARGELQVVEREREALAKERAALEARIAATRDLPATLRNQLTSQQIEGPERQLAAINKQLEQMDDRAAQIRSNLGDKLSDAISASSRTFAAQVREVTAATKASEAAGKQAAAQAEQRRKSLEAMGMTELQLAAANAGNLQEELRLRREIVDRGIEAQVRGLKGLTGPERELEIARRKALQDAIEYANTQDRIRQAEAARLKQLRDFMKEQKGLLDALRGNVSSWQGQQLGKPVEVGGDLPKGTFGLPDAQRAVSKKTQKTIEEQIAAEQQRIEVMRQAAHGIATLSEELLGLNAGTANAIRAVSDLAAGIATKNPAMIISGGLGLIGSIFGDGGRAERQQAREARFNQLEDINSFIDSISPRGTDLEELTKSYRELHAEGKKLGLGNHELARLTQAYANEQARLIEVERVRNALMAEDLEVRALAAQGYDEEAEALRFALDQQREYTEALEEGYSEANLAALAHVLALEAEAEALRVARQELELFRQQLDLGADFAERSARLGGDDAGADLIGINRRFEREWERIQDLVSEGVLTLAESYEWLILLRGEEAKAIDDLTESIREQQEAMALLVRNAEEDLRVRELRAMGLDAEADALQRTIDWERELQRLRDQGLPESVIAYAEYVQGLESARLATDRLAESVEAMAKKAREEAYAFDELATRRLSAMGNTDAANEAAMYAQQQRQLDSAIADGRSAGYLAELEAVQAMERARFRQEREQRQLADFQAAADHNFSLTDPFAETSRTSQNLAVGFTGSQADRIAGILGTGVAIAQQSLAVQQRMEQHLARLVALGARTTGLSPEQMAFEIEQLTDASARALGINPGR